MDNKKIYWKGTEQLTNDPEFVQLAEKEFPEYLPINDDKEQKEGNASRRDFLKLMGFSVAAASLAACEAPVRKAIPYLNKPVEIDPGIPNYYASTYLNGGDYGSILVKTREGRPIKIEGNKLSQITQGGTDAQMQASVLSLYDKERLTGPMKEGRYTTWNSLDKEIVEYLTKFASDGTSVKLVTRSLLSPSTKKAIEALQAKFPNIEVVTYDPISASGMLEANQASFGISALPAYHFDKAKTIVSFSADFLGTWINPVKYSRDFAKTRKLGNGKKEMSRLYSWEAILSLTGSNADYRTPVKPSKEGLIVANLYNKVASAKGGQTISVPSIDDEQLNKAAQDLLKSQGKALVVSGSNDMAVQVLVNATNELLGANGNTIDISKPAYYRQGIDKEMNAFISDSKAGKVKAVVFYNANPVYDHPRGSELAEALKGMEFVLSTSDRKDETTELAKFIAPDHHFLESWNDAEPEAGSYSLAQPTISPLFKTRQAQESFLSWAGGEKNYFEFIKNFWKENVYTGQLGGFDMFFDKCLHDGVYVKDAAVPSQLSFNTDVASVAGTIASNYKADVADNELVIYQKVGLGDGSHANNPWLHEMPDPISKACWDNYLTVSQKWANDNNVSMVESRTVLVELKAGSSTVKLPALVQPGQAEGTFGIALGYGRTKAGKVGNGVGTNAYPMLNGSDYISNTVSGVTISVTTEEYKIPQTQTHQTFMGRENVVQETTLSKYQKDPDSGRWHPHIAASNALEKKLGDAVVDGKLKPGVVTLWEGHAYPNHHWGMAIDMNSCTGCSACVVSCNAENNVPVVGRDEVLMRREMHWLRIDRYYSSDAAPEDRIGLEKASSNPEVTFQPMMCQQCNNAPCETVCPVAATTHSSEGLNQMTYNRCIGTRYCANNCPYKVRRFNWFKYHDNEKFGNNLSMNNDLGKMVLNPDVTVRSRGVMEKCTFCVQRLQAGKLEAKKDGRALKDGDVSTACASACPTEAIVFGDLRNPNSKIAKMLKFEDKGKYQEVKEERAYNVLEEIGVKPNVWYMTKIRNKDNNA